MYFNVCFPLPIVKKDKDATDFLKKIGNNVRDLRKKQKLTQKQLAFECELEVRLIQRIENGEHNTGVWHLAIIAKILEVDLSELIKL
jgi:transcriptional regulator with XRE-family HTH domain